MSSVQTSDLIVLVGRRAGIAGVRDVLQDLSVAGLVAPIHFVDVDAIRPDSALLPCVVLEEGATRGVVLQEELATRVDTDHVRVVAITELVAGERATNPDDALRIVEVVAAALPSCEPSRLHVVGVTTEGRSANSDIAWLGWHNVVVAPESSQSPWSGVAPVVDQPGDPVRGNHFASTLCSIVGGWVVEPRSPWDGRGVPPAKTLVAARTFSRHLSASAVGSQLLGRLASVDEGYPVPLVDGASAWVVDDEVAAAREAAEALLAKHHHVLPRRREHPRSTPQTKIGAIEALGKLFVFLWGVVRGLPGAMMNAMVRKVSSMTASMVTGAVFGGTESEFVVVVNGYRADGSPASWVEIDEALDAATARLAGRTDGQESANADLSELWRDFIAGGMTLLDAAHRVPEISPRMLSGRPGIITTAARVAPDPGEFFQMPESVAAWIADRVVSSYDPVAARTLDQQLDELAARQPHVAGQARKAQSELKTWFEDKRRSYTGAVGWRLAEAVREVRGEIAQLAARLREAQAASELPGSVEAQQRTLGRRLLGMAGIAVLAVLGAVLLLVLGPLTAVMLAVVLIVVVTVWLASSVMVFLRGQRDLFALIHQREQLAAELATLRRHLAEALQDLRRLSRAYRQYLDWCRAFGRFVQAPVGSPAILTDDAVLPGAGFPLNHRFGAARPEEAVLDDVAARLSRDLFGVGWLSEAWTAFLHDVPAEMGTQAFRVQEDPALLFADPGVTRQSLLTTWAAAVTRRTGWTAATTPLRSSLAELLGGPAQQLASRLLANVECRDQRGELASMNYETFFNGLDQVASGPGASNGRFARSLWSADVGSTDPWAVADTAVTVSMVDLGRTMVVTQLSGGFQSYELSSRADMGVPPASDWDDEREGDVYRPVM